MRAEAAVGFHANGPLFFKETVTCQHILAKLSKTQQNSKVQNVKKFHSPILQLSACNRWTKTDMEGLTGIFL